LGAGVYQLMGYFLNLWFGPRWPLIFGIVFILIVLFFPYGIVGTWRQRGSAWKSIWRERWRRVRTVGSAS
jgi:ABC-type branched-subunit amino acid transport system permease subunit